MKSSALTSGPAAEPSEKPPYIGGQAVLEGVMMRSPKSFAVVVRSPGGELRFRERPIAGEVAPWKKRPLVRGVMSLVESLRLGNEALKFSVEVLEAGERAKAVTGGAAAALSGATRFAVGLQSFVAALGAEPALGGAAAPARGGEKKEGGAMGALMVVAALTLFVALPQLSAALVNRGLGLALEVQSPGFQALTGLFKLVVVVGYLSAIRQIPDIRRMFQYHGAEHKAISTYEAHLPLTVEAARPFTTRHPRCGTTFLVMVALVSVVAFTAVGALLPRIATGNAFLDNVVFFFEKLPFVPLLAGVTFELQRITATNVNAAWVRPFLVPGYLVQGITTIEPDDDQLAVALASLQVTLDRERGAVAGDAVREGVLGAA
jgi:uncharacterized protein YqhQ